MTDTIEMLPLPTGYSADEWGGRDTGPCLYTDEQMQDYARANVAHATAPLQDEIEALRAELDRVLGEHVRKRRELAASKSRAERLAEALLELCEAGNG